MASSAGCSRGLVKTNPAIRPAAVPMAVSAIRPTAAARVALERMNIALTGTSRTASPRCRAEPTASPAAIVRPRLHHVNPARSASGDG